MINALRSEWIKLTTTRGFAMGVAVFLLIGILLPITFAVVDASGGGAGTGSGALAALSNFGLIALMIVSGAMVTQEFRHRTIMLALCANPRRSVVTGAKAILASTITAALVVPAVLVAFIATLLITNAPHRDVSLAGLLPALARAVFATVLVVLMAQGIAYLVRRISVLATLACLVPTVVELGLCRLPGVGDRIQPYLIFANVSHALVGEVEGRHFYWDQWGSVAYLAGVAAVFFVVGLAVVQRRAPRE